MSNTLEALDKIIESTNGRFFTVCFVKKDNTERLLTGRLGVTKHLKGGKSTIDNTKYITVYDTRAKGYRAINRDTIKFIHFQGKVYN